MTYPSLTDNFNLEIWNANFRELKEAQDDVPSKTLMFYPDNQFGSIVSTDLDAITTSGFYTCASSATNAPFTTASAFIYHHQANAATDAWQRATSYADGSEKIRYKRASTWTSWVDFVSGDMLASVYATNGATGTVDNSIALNGHADTYFQAAESGKGLSTNDYTTAEKTKLSGIAENANNYSLPTMATGTKGGAKLGDGLSITDDILSAAVKGLVSTVAAFNSQTASTENAADSYIMKQVIDNMSISSTAVEVLTTAFATYSATLTGETDLITAGYIYKASISLTGVTADHIAEVIFGAVEATGGNFAPIAITGAGVIYIYAKAQPSATITIPTVNCRYKGA